MKFELCAASIEAVLLAKELNFDRIELCQNLEQGGLTPSYGLIAFAQSLQIETHVLIRPRPGGFTYTKEEVDVIINDIKICKNLGVKGIVVGALLETGEIDKDFLNKIKSHAGNLELTFHRAFDDSIEWKPSLDVLIEAGVKRVLSSGMALDVDSGFQILKQMVEYAEDKIEIMTGGGVNLSNISKIINEIKPSAIHFSGTSKVLLDEESMFSETSLKVDKTKVERMLNAISVK